jgi:hypothetical protein
MRNLPLSEHRRVIRDLLRTLLKIRVARGAAAMGAKPEAGSLLILAGMRLLVTSIPVDDLWYFFSRQGWREIDHPRRDRRHYVDLPPASFEWLARADGPEREARYRHLVAVASRRCSAPAVRRSATTGR